MSSFPNHVENINELKDAGVDVSHYLDCNGNVDIDSWSHDALTDILSDAILKINSLDSENKKLKFMIDNDLGWDDVKGGNIEDVS